jgi:hypothetical protein
MASIRPIHWLVRDEDRALRAHVLLGDHIAFGDSPAWFTPAPVGAASGSSILMLRYECGDEAVLFCVLPPDGVGRAEVEALRASISLEGAERAWRPFVERLGPSLQRAGHMASWQESRLDWAGRALRVRRARHGNHVIERLLLRERGRLLEPFGGLAA